MNRRRIVIVAMFLLAVLVGVLLAFGPGGAASKTVLPIPNGYDDFTAAGQWLVTWSGDLPKMSAEEIRDIIKQNAKALETVHRGLKKQSAVPVVNDLNWLNTHFTQISTTKQLAQLLVGEGLAHLHEGRTNEAARSFADCIAFAHAANRQGLMIDGLMAFACQAIGAKQLVLVAPHLSPEMRREILAGLIALDQAREPAAAILQRDREWARAAHGWARMTWARIFTSKSIRITEMRFEKNQARSVAGLRLLMTELALRGHEAKSGKPPAALAELVPDWLPAAPLDPFSNQPLIYRVGTGTFVLYSVGTDGKDDGGTPPQRGTGEKGDLLPTSP